jgi:hypothetical protein
LPFGRDGRHENIPKVSSLCRSGGGEAPENVMRNNNFFRTQKIYIIIRFSWFGCEPTIYVSFPGAGRSSLSPNRINISRYFALMAGNTGKIYDLSPYQQKLNEKRE